MAMWSRRWCLPVLLLVFIGCRGESRPTAPRRDISQQGETGFEPQGKQDPQAGDIAETIVASDEQLDAIAAIETAGGSLQFDEGPLPVTIDLASDRVFADDSVVRAVLLFPELKRLRLAVSNVTPATLTELKTLTRLQELMLQDAAVTDDALRASVAAMPALERLTLRRLNQVTDEGIQAVAADCDLKVLALIEMNQLTGSALQHLDGLQRLRSLDLRNCGGFSAEDFSKLLELQPLTELKLGGPVVNDQVLATVIQLPALDSLTIEDADVTEEGWQQLAANEQLAAQLKSLTIARCFSVTDETLEMVGRLPKLESVAVRDVMINGEFLTAASSSAGGLPLLKSLVLNDTFLGDQAIAGLPNVAPNLERLDLRRNTGVTDQSLTALRQLRNLKEIHLGDTGVSDSAAERLSADIASGVLHGQATEADPED